MTSRLCRSLLGTAVLVALPLIDFGSRRAPVEPPRVVEEVSAPLPAPHDDDIRRILRSDTTKQAKVRALAKYVRVGDQLDDALKKLGPPCIMCGHGPGFVDVMYLETGLIVACYPDDEVYGVGHFPPPACKVVWLEVVNPVTWPREARLASAANRR